MRADSTDEDKQRFQQLRYGFPDERIMRRFEILWHQACGKFSSKIAIIVQQNADSVRDAIKNFQHGGFELVTTIDSNHPTSDLEKHRDSIIEEFALRPPASSKEAAARIEKLTGIQRSEQRIRVFMKRSACTMFTTKPSTTSPQASTIASAASRPTANPNSKHSCNPIFKT